MSLLYHHDCFAFKITVYIYIVFTHFSGKKIKIEKNLKPRFFKILRIHVHLCVFFLTSRAFFFSLKKRKIKGFSTHFLNIKTNNESYYSITELKIKEILHCINSKRNNEKQITLVGTKILPER